MPLLQTLRIRSARRVRGRAPSPRSAGRAATHPRASLFPA